MDFLLHRVYTAKELPYPDGITPQDREDAERIWKFMDGLPLALDQAAAYIEETDCTLGHYLTLLETHSKPLLHRRGKGASAHPESAARTLWLSFEKVMQKSLAAADLLRFSAFLDPDAIPESLIIDGADALGPALQAITKNKLKWEKAMGALRSYSMVKRKAEKGTFSMHRLAQSVIRDSMTKKVGLEWARRVVLAVNAAFPDPKSDSWSQCESLLPHALLAALYIEEYKIFSEEAGRLLYVMATYLQERGRYADAEPLSQLALRIREQQLGPEHPDVATSLNNLANLYSQQGNDTMAEPLFQRALRIRERLLGSEHPETAQSLNDLANLYYKQSKDMEAEPLYKRALYIWEQQLGPEHPRVANPLNNLANLYSQQGRDVEAEPLFQRALYIWEQQLGPEHPLVATLLNNLAILYLLQGNDAKAEPLFQRALRIREQQLGPEHPHVAVSLSNLGEFYLRQGNDAKAEPLYQRALRIREQRLGPEHPDVAISLNNLADLYFQQGKYAKAEPLYQRALQIFERQMVPEHPLVAYPLNGLAKLYHEQGMEAEAEPFYWRALRIREQQLGFQHSETTETRGCLIALLHALERHEEAARLEAVQTKP